jgi:hypothetical protein
MKLVLVNLFCKSYCTWFFISTKITSLKVFSRHKWELLLKHKGSPPVFIAVRVAGSLVFYVIFCRSLYVIFLLPFIYCHSFFDLRLLITPLVLYKGSRYEYRVMVMVFNATFNNISIILWRLILLVDETGVPRENHRPVASHWQTL